MGQGRVQGRGGVGVRSDVRDGKESEGRKAVINMCKRCGEAGGRKETEVKKRNVVQEKKCEKEKRM